MAKASLIALVKFTEKAIVLFILASAAGGSK